MTSEDKTRSVFFSELIKSEQPFNQAWERLKDVLDRHRITYDFLKGTDNIWCRDYMPIQIDKNRFVQFVYDPPYDRANPQRHESIIVSRLIGLDAQCVDIGLDGGNVVRGYDKAIISERLFDENPDFDPKKLVRELEKVLEAEVIIIPCLDKDLDMTGHADGYVRFVNESTLIGNDRRIECKNWTAKMNRVLKEKSLEYIDLPMFDCPIGEKGKSAIGTYVNYLETGNLIIMPAFEVRGNRDAEALDIMTESFPERIIEAVNINEIGIEGGLLNCISWTMDL